MGGVIDMWESIWPQVVTNVLNLIVSAIACAYFAVALKNTFLMINFMIAFCYPKIEGTSADAFIGANLLAKRSAYQWGCFVLLFFATRS